MSVQEISCRPADDIKKGGMKLNELGRERCDFVTLIAWTQHAEKHFPV